MALTDMLNKIKGLLGKKGQSDLPIPDSMKDTASQYIHNLAEQADAKTGNILHSQISDVEKKANEFLGKTSQEDAKDNPPN